MLIFAIVCFLDYCITESGLKRFTSSWMSSCSAGLKHLKHDKKAIFGFTINLKHNLNAYFKMQLTNHNLTLYENTGYH